MWPAPNSCCGLRVLAKSGPPVRQRRLSSMLRVVVGDPERYSRGLAKPVASGRLGAAPSKPKSPNQRRYLEAIEKARHGVGVGPAGTGKTYLAVAMAISALLNKQVTASSGAPRSRGGERLGFLPGTLQEKIDPYLEPLYDALFDMLDPERVERLSRKKILSRSRLSPLARTHAQRLVRHSR